MSFRPKQLLAYHTFWGLSSITIIIFGYENREGGWTALTPFLLSSSACGRPPYRKACAFAITLEHKGRLRLKRRIFDSKDGYAALGTDGGNGSRHDYIIGFAILKPIGGGGGEGGAVIPHHAHTPYHKGVEDGNIGSVLEHLAGGEEIRIHNLPRQGVMYREIPRRTLAQNNIH